MSRKEEVIANIDWRNHEGSTVIMGICPRSPAVRGRNLTSMLDLIQTKVSKVHLVICDTLDRYNFQNDREVVLQDGQDWLETNLKEYQSRFDEITVQHWDEVMSSESFEEKHRVIRETYEKNKLFKKIIDDNVSYFLTPKMKKLGWDFDYDKEFRNSTDYLLEEYAGMSIWTEWYPNIPEIYWGIYMRNEKLFNNFTDEVDLSLPKVLPVAINRLGPSKVGDILICQKKQVA